MKWSDERSEERNAMKASYFCPKKFLHKKRDVIKIVLHFNQ
jgi:hypothetical protein